jgi:hypothetical protein
MRVDRRQARTRTPYVALSGPALRELAIGRYETQRKRADERAG